MSRRNWINLFSNSQAIKLSSDLERGYEAALLIQSLELEYYGDRQLSLIHISEPTRPY